MIIYFLKLNAPAGCYSATSTCSRFYWDKYPQYSYGGYHWFLPAVNVGYNNITYSPVQFFRGTVISFYPGNPPVQLALQVDDDSLYPDYFADAMTYHQKIDYIHNYRYYLNVKIDKSYYESTSKVKLIFPINTTIEQFSISAKFSSSSTEYSRDFYISNCKFILF